MNTEYQWVDGFKSKTYTTFSIEQFETPLKYNKTKQNSDIY